MVSAFFALVHDLTRGLRGISVVKLVDERWDGVVPLRYIEGARQRSSTVGSMNRRQSKNEPRPNRALDIHWPDVDCL
jgi:hypothetical protein